MDKPTLQTYIVHLRQDQIDFIEAYSKDAYFSPSLFFSRLMDKNELTEVPEGFDNPDLIFPDPNAPEANVTIAMVVFTDLTYKRDENGEVWLKVSPRTCEEHEAADIGWQPCEEHLQVCSVPPLGYALLNPTDPRTHD
jgi:hypothetical protein